MQNPLPLNNLNAFAAAAEHLSFQKAAETLFVTPSAVSHQIRNLEKILGYSLFERLDKKVRLTSQGESLFSEIQTPIKQLQTASRKALRGSEQNSLALSVAPLFATGWLLSRLKNFQVSHPEINLTVIATSDMVNFTSDPFDASIRMGSGDWEGVSIHRLFNCKIVTVCHPSLLGADKSLMTPPEISNYPLVNNTTLPSLWNSWFKTAGCELSADINYSVQVQSSAQVIEVLQSGDSIGLVDQNFIENDIGSGRLALACDHVLEADAGYYLTAPKATEALLSFQVFKGWLDETMEKSGGRLSSYAALPYSGRIG